MTFALNNPAHAEVYNLLAQCNITVTRESSIRLLDEVDRLAEAVDHDVPTTVRAYNDFLDAHFFELVVLFGTEFHKRVPLAILL